jgi:hypothetical protein
VSGVALYWLPLGADGNPAVRWGGRLYEALAARRSHRSPQALFHSALLVEVDADETWAVEMAPVWQSKEPERGVVAEGPVGRRWLGRSRMFRYEVRRWRNGTIPDLGAAIGTPVRFTITPAQAHALLDLVPTFPTMTWGLDELGVGDMWNSNSLVSWLLASSGLPVRDLRPPVDGRAPGWAAGVVAARAHLQHVESPTA